MVGNTNANNVVFVQSGRTSSGASVSAGTYVDVPITFPQAFKSAPEVVACLRATSTSMGYAQLQCVVLNSSVTTTGFSARVYNGYSNGLSPFVSWIAMGEKA